MAGAGLPGPGPEAAPGPRLCIYFHAGPVEHGVLVVVGAAPAPLLGPEHGPSSPTLSTRFSPRRVHEKAPLRDKPQQCPELAPDGELCTSSSCTSTATIWSLIT